MTEIVENKYLDIRKEPDPIRFHDFAKKYLKWSIENKKPSAKTREMSMMRSLDREFGEKFLHTITSFDIEGWKVKRKKANREKAKKKREVKPATVNRELAVLKTLFNKAVEWGKLKESPARKVKPLNGGVNRLRYLMPDEVQRLISNCSDHLKPIVIVAVHTGMRKGELLSLRWDQVDFQKGIITLTDTKNNECRHVPMDETVKSTLMALERKTEYIFCGLKPGRPLVWIEMSFHKALEKSGIEDFKIHDLRHTFASNLVMSGKVDLNRVRQLLGHKSLEMTLTFFLQLPRGSVL
jgi:integrase